MSATLITPKMKAADLLLRGQSITQAQYDQVSAQVQRGSERAEEVMIDAGVMTEAELLRALSAQYRTHFVTTEKLSRAEIPRATVQMIPRRVAETLGVFPVMFDSENNVLSVVTADPDKTDVLREIQLVSGARDVKAFVARPAAVVAAIQKHHGGDPRAFGALERAAMGHMNNMPFERNLMPDGTIGTGAMRLEREREINPTAPAQTPIAQPAPPPPPPAVQAPAPQPARVSVPAKKLSAPPPPDKPSTPLFLDAPPPPAKRHKSDRMEARHSSEPPSDMSSSTSSQVSVPRTNSGLHRQLAVARDTTVELLAVMVSLLENSRQELRGHSSQVSRLLKRVAERMNLDREMTYAVTVASFIHDLGKMGQFHLTPLNSAEYEGHKVAAQKAHDTPLRLLESVNLSQPIKQAVFHMYERFDGKGFPDGLVGKEIPLAARLLAIADTYADLTQNSRNPYRKTLAPPDAVAVLEKHANKVFDGGLVDLFKSIVLGEGLRAKLLANRYTVLIVDSDPEETTVLELRMIEQAFEVKIARSIEAAKKLLKEGGEFDLVVSELDMPDGDGLKFLAESRKEAWGKDLPWVIHTRRQGGKEAQKAFGLGILDFVAKPMSSDVLVAKLKAMIDQWQTGRGARGVSGSLQEMGLPDIVQILFHGRKTGKLNIRSGGEMGEIHFIEGNVAHAILGKLRGVDAFYAMLKYQEGEFGLDPSFKPTVRVIEESAEALLLEGMRRMDEGLA